MTRICSDSWAGLRHLRNAALVLAAAGFLLAPAEGFAAAADTISGTWWTTTYSPRIKPADGSEIPFTPKGKAAYDEIVAGLKSGALKDEAVRTCVPPGVPRMWTTAYPFMITSTSGTPDLIVMIFEENVVTRYVQMNVEPLSDEELELIEAFLGSSYGRWEGDTLVVDVRGFNEKTYLDASGLPHTYKLRVTERIRAINNGRQLEVVSTIEDPEMYSKPWSVRHVFEKRPDVVLDSAYTCGEPHRDLSSVRGAPR